MHIVVPIPQDLKKGNPLYPKTSMSLVDAERQNLVTKLNSIVSGTKYEFETLYQTIKHSAANPEDSLIFNLASQIWNLGFFIQQLSKHRGTPRNDIQERIIRSFGSMQSFHQEFVSAAESIAGDGWTWLIEDQFDNLKFVNTLNAGTPLIPRRMQMTQGLSYETTCSVLPNPSIPWTLSPSAPQGAYIPILNLNLWQSGYIADYGSEIDRYVTIFLNHTNWDVIRSRLIRNLY